jgi:hypothetical protein
MIIGAPMTEALTYAQLGERLRVSFGEPHLRNLLRSYQRYYNEGRTHLSLCKDAPIPRAVHPRGHIVVTPILGGLHYQYGRV